MRSNSRQPPSPSGMARKSRQAAPTRRPMTLADAPTVDFRAAAASPLAVPALSDARAIELGTTVKHFLSAMSLPRLSLQQRTVASMFSQFEMPTEGTTLNTVAPKQQPALAAGTARKSGKADPQSVKKQVGATSPSKSAATPALESAEARPEPVPHVFIGRDRMRPPGVQLSEAGLFDTLMHPSSPRLGAPWHPATATGASALTTDGALDAFQFPAVQAAAAAPAATLSAVTAGSGRPTSGSPSGAAGGLTATVAGALPPRSNPVQPFAAASWDDAWLRLQAYYRRAHGDGLRAHEELGVNLGVNVAELMALERAYSTRIRAAVPQFANIPSLGLLLLRLFVTDSQTLSRALLPPWATAGDGLNGLHQRSLSFGAGGPTVGALRTPRRGSRFGAAALANATATPSSGARPRNATAPGTLGASSEAAACGRGGHATTAAHAAAALPVPSTPKRLDAQQQAAAERAAVLAKLRAFMEDKERGMLDALGGGGVASAARVGVAGAGRSPTPRAKSLSPALRSLSPPGSPVGKKQKPPTPGELASVSDAVVALGGVSAVTKGIRKRHAAATGIAEPSSQPRITGVTPGAGSPRGLNPVTGAIANDDESDEEEDENMDPRARDAMFFDVAGGGVALAAALANSPGPLLPRLRNHNVSPLHSAFARGFIARDRHEMSKWCGSIAGCVAAVEAALPPLERIVLTAPATNASAPVTGKARPPTPTDRRAPTPTNSGATANHKPGAATATNADGYATPMLRLVHQIAFPHGHATREAFEAFVTSRDLNSVVDLPLLLRYRVVESSFVFPRLPKPSKGGAGKGKSGGAVPSSADQSRATPTAAAGGKRNSATSAGGAAKAATGGRKNAMELPSRADTDFIRNWADQFDWTDGPHTSDVSAVASHLTTPPGATSAGGFGVASVPPALHLASSQQQQQQQRAVGQTTSASSSVTSGRRIESWDGRPGTGRPAPGAIGNPPSHGGTSYHSDAPAVTPRRGSSPGLGLSFTVSSDQRPAAGVGADGEVAAILQSNQAAGDGNPQTITSGPQAPSIVSPKKTSATPTRTKRSTSRDGLGGSTTTTTTGVPPTGRRPSLSAAGLLQNSSVTSAPTLPLPPPPPAPPVARARMLNIVLEVPAEHVLNLAPFAADVAGIHVASPFVADDDDEEEATAAGSGARSGQNSRPQSGRKGFTPSPVPQQQQQDGNATLAFFPTSSLPAVTPLAGSGFATTIIGDDPTASAGAPAPPLRFGKAASSAVAATEEAAARLASTPRRSSMDLVVTNASGDQLSVPAALATSDDTEDAAGVPHAFCGGAYLHPFEFLPPPPPPSDGSKYGAARLRSSSSVGAGAVTPLAGPAADRANRVLRAMGYQGSASNALAGQRDSSPGAGSASAPPQQPPLRSAEATERLMSKQRQLVNTDDVVVRPFLLARFVGYSPEDCTLRFRIDRDARPRPDMMLFTATVVGDMRRADRVAAQVYDRMAQRFVRPHYCPAHPAFKLTRLCRTCDKFICESCAVKLHQQHEMVAKGQRCAELIAYLEPQRQVALRRLESLRRLMGDAAHVEGGLRHTLDVAMRQVRDSLDKRREALRSDGEQRAEKYRAALTAEMEAVLGDAGRVADALGRVERQRRGDLVPVPQVEFFQPRQIRNELAMQLPTKYVQQLVSLLDWSKPSQYLTRDVYPPPDEPQHRALMAECAAASQKVRADFEAASEAARFAAAIALAREEVQQ